MYMPFLYIVCFIPVEIAFEPNRNLETYEATLVRTKSRTAAISTYKRYNK